jgi:hypothetical protein
MNPTQLERAARHYCLLANLNPDEQLKLQKPIPGAHGPIDSVPRWKVISNALADQWRVNEALRVGLEPV